MMAQLTDDGIVALIKKVGATGRISLLTEDRDGKEILSFLGKLLLGGKETNSGRNRWVKQTTFYNESTGSGNCTEAAVASILNVPLEDIPKFYTGSIVKFWDSFENEFTKRGYTLVRLLGNHEPDCLYLASGNSNRGCKHMVVRQKDRLVHDPHPSNDGINEIDNIWVPVPIDISKQAGDYVW